MNNLMTARGTAFRRLVAVLLIGFCATMLMHADERLLISTTINGKSARLAFDTGASDSLLFPKTAERLGLAYTNPPKDIHLEVGESPMGRTEECELLLGESEIRTSFGVIEVPTMLAWDVDGVLGWKPLSHNIFLIDARAGTVSTLNRVPEETASWIKLKLRPNSELLRLELPLPNGKRSVLFIDTGSSNGVKLAPEKWRTWKAAHKEEPTTLDAYYAPSTGLVVAEESWARELSLGPLTLTDVPVTAASAAEAKVGSKRNEAEDDADPPEYEATFGLAALKRLDFVIDGKKEVAYLLPKKSPPPAYEHNRIGAVFTPINMQANDLIARVAEGSPAHHAGIRDGDILLKIGELDATKWRTDPAVMPLTKFWTRPPGTKLELTLKRGQENYKANVLLRQILTEGNAREKIDER